MRFSRTLERLGRSSYLCTRGWQAATARNYSTATIPETDQPSVSGCTDDGPIFAACVLQRLPLVRSPPLPLYTQHWIRERQRGLETGELKDYPEVAASGREDTANKQQQQEARKFDPVPTTTSADAAENVRTMRRRLQDSLYLVVRDKPASSDESGDGQGARRASGAGGSGGWAFPAATNSGEESISATAQRALSSVIGRSHPVFWVGNAPLAHVRALPKGNTFFMLAQVVDDPWDVQLVKGGPAQDYAWVTKQELLSGFVSDVRLRELISKML